MIAFCIIAFGLATDIMDFIEKESELQEGFVFGQGWSWVEDNAEENSKQNIWTPGKNDKHD